MKDRHVSLPRRGVGKRPDLVPKLVVHRQREDVGFVPLSPDEVPRFSASVAGLRSFHAIEPGSRRMASAPTVFIHFTGAADAALPLAGDPATLGFFQRVDGKRSYRAIARELRGRTSLRAVLAFAQTLVRLGVLESTPQAGKALRDRSMERRPS